MKKIKKRKIKKIFKQKIDLKTINFFLKRSPVLSSGRKNYKAKEILNAKNICLAKLYKCAEKHKAKSISNIKFKRKKEVIMINADLNL